MKTNGVGRKWLAVAVTLLGVSLAGALPASAQRVPGRRTAPEDKTTGFRENPRLLAVFKNVVAGPGKSVVRVRSDDKDVALGTVVAADGYVLTKNSELLPGARPTVVLRDGRKLDAKVTGVDLKHDLAMLKIDAKNLVPVQWGESRSAAVGDLLAAPGPDADAEPVAVGVLSVAARAVRPRDLPPSTPPANSGYLGVMLEEAEGGARIVMVTPRSAAANAGLRERDVVTLIAGTPIIDAETMINTIQHHRPGEAVTIKVRRGEKEVEVEATLDKRPPETGFDRRDYQNKLGSALSNRRGGFPQVLQHDMAIRPMDCGGPVVDLDGKAIGVNIARAGRVESYALPAEAVQALIEELKNGKLAVRTESPGTTKPAGTQAAK
jgi:serine protease Do